MLCSNCGQSVRPIICLDIDGTMGDYHKHFIKFTLAYLGERPTLLDATVNSYLGEGTMRDWFCDLLDVSPDTWYDIKLAYRQGAQKRSMPCYPWGPNLTHLLKDRAEIWITTTRPYLRLDGVDPDTRFWLDNNGFYFDYLLYDEEKYGELAKRVDRRRVVAVVDDLPEELASAAHFLGDVGILYRATHNKIYWDEYPGDQIAHDGQTIKQIIDRRLNDWYERYGTQGLLEVPRTKTQPS